ncbi:hypothetical protein B296_00041855 [Ensete ventricosum]|uniref:Uncharacterized protein n=1 Tax=Ensete ventricosum TaxID=4639 RepID=A0A426ZKH8_ENSVE|nr:hypothetical protein B296_00041855 [Ensete ventricosum]
MWCYVGKATKICFFVVVVLLVVGLILGFGFIRHGSKGHGECDSDSDACHPALPQPVPATSATSAPPLNPPSPDAREGGE